jgi:hypothetical protein
MRLKIRAREPLPDSARVWVCDDQTGESVELTGDLAELVLRLSKEEVTTVALRITPTELDVDAEAIKALQAHAEERRTIRS